MFNDIAWTAVMKNSVEKLILWKIIYMTIQIIFKNLNTKEVINDNTNAFKTYLIKRDSMCRKIILALSGHIYITN